MHPVYPIPPEILIPLGTTVIRRKMHYPLCENGEFSTLKTRRLDRVIFRKDFWDCY